MFPAPPRPGNDDHADPAAFWFARLNGGGPTSAEDEAGFRRWLDEDSENPRAYRSCQQTWRLLELDAAEPEVLALRSAALGPEDRRFNRRRALFGLTGGAVAAACGGLWLMTSASPARALISTRAGQRLTAPLPDGSEVTLAPLTRLRLDFGQGRRAVVLETGQAYFNILPDAALPFSLRVGERELTTEQGRFQLTYLDDRPDILVEQGQLSLADRGGEGAVVRLKTGQRVDVRNGRLEKAAADVEAWVRADLLFHRSILDACGNELMTPLGALIAHMLEAMLLVNAKRAGRFNASLAEHTRVLEAIRRRDGAQARAAMESLLGVSRSRLSARGAAAIA